MPRRSRFANFLLETQSNSSPGDEGALTLSLVWTCETIWEDQRKLLNMKTAKSLRWAAELQDFIEEHKSNNTVRNTISIWHEALWYNDELDKRTETTVSIMIKLLLYTKSDKYNQFDFCNLRALNTRCICRSRLFWHQKSCNKSLIDRVCSGRTGRISALSLSCTDLAEGARSVLPRPRADILPVRPSHSVNKIYV